MRGLALGICLLGLLLSGCRQSPPAPKAGTPHQVRYQLDWVWDDGQKIPGGTAWEVTNDLGYRVRVTRGYVTSYSMELVECPKNAATTPVARLGTFLRLAVEGTAFAGHATGTPNPAAIHPMQVESLTEPKPQQLRPVLLSQCCS
jgi:hypothetical protein